MSECGAAYLGLMPRPLAAMRQHPLSERSLQRPCRAALWESVGEAMAPPIARVARLRVGTAWAAALRRAAVFRAEPTGLYPGCRAKDFRAAQFRVPDCHARDRWTAQRTRRDRPVAWAEPARYRRR